MRKMTFSVKASKNAKDSHDVFVTLPEFEDATEDQRKVAWTLLTRSNSLRVQTQGALRNLLGKGVEGDALMAAAQSIVDDVLAGRRVRAEASDASVIDASTFPGGLDAKQIAALEASNVIVINKP
jgi:hypothetical protein